MQVASAVLPWKLGVRQVCYGVKPYVTLSLPYSGLHLVWHMGMWADFQLRVKKWLQLAFSVGEGACED
jgi:hypothetical protein